MHILDRLEAQMASFRPRNPAEFVALQLARRFDDLNRLPRYVAAAQAHSKNVLLEAASGPAPPRAESHPTADLFFEVLAERDQEVTPP